jgi:hypothetical protein
MFGMVVPTATINISMAPAWHAESAAVCAAWRWNHRFVRSTAKPTISNRKIASISRRDTMIWPDSARSLETGGAAMLPETARTLLSLRMILRLPACRL